MIEVRNITKTFGGLVAVDNCSLEVGAGTITGMIGPNGAGKSTLFNIIAGFLPPTSGQIVLDGNDITKLPPPASAARSVSWLKSADARAAVIA